MKKLIASKKDPHVVVGTGDDAAKVSLQRSMKEAPMSPFSALIASRREGRKT
jgi:hypothetical protein